VTPSPQSIELARRLAALPELQMRVQALQAFLEEHEPAEVVRVLAEVHSLGRRAGPPFNVALLSLVALISGEQLEYELRASLYAAAKEAGLEALLALFYSSRQEGAESLRQSEVQRELTLGHRKWMARGSRREVLDRLLHDPEPEVVPILLGNPRIVERDVVLLAARRPARLEVQWQIFESPKWIARYAVKRALVLNPWTPTELAIRLLAFLNAQDLALVVSSPSLPEAVRDAAGKLGDYSGGGGGG
jgi:hypothetical protein